MEPGDPLVMVREISPQRAYEAPHDGADLAISQDPVSRDLRFEG